VTLSKNDFRILIIMKDNGFISQMQSCTIKRIEELINLSTNKIRITFKVLNLLGFVKEGAVDHNSKTYYITNAGIEKIKTI